MLALLLLLSCCLQLSFAQPLPQQVSCVAADALSAACLLPATRLAQGVSCPRGDGCPYTHHVYEYWLHPKRFRTLMCQQVGVRLCVMAGDTGWLVHV
jgi:hypothetical protein